MPHGPLADGAIDIPGGSVGTDYYCRVSLAEGIRTSCETVDSI